MVHVELRILGTDFSKGIHGKTSQISSAGYTLAVGQSGFLYAGVGEFNQQGFDAGNLCTNFIGSEQAFRKQELLFQSPHVWFIEVQALPVEFGKISLKTNWESYYSKRRGSAQKRGGDARGIILREKESHFLDYINVAPSDKFLCNSNIIVEITAEIEEDTTLKDKLLRYDIWLQHKGKSGEVEDRRCITSGRQGDKTDFYFFPLRFPINEGILSDGSSLEMILEISGNLRGRIRSDGTIMVELDAMRWIDAERTGSSRRGGVGDGGTKIFSLKPGESVQFILPRPTGASGLSDFSKEHISKGPSPAAKNNINIGEGFVVDHGEFFDGHEDSLILTVTID
ncbi:MAG: hypothetical protein AB1756_06325 [Acidobacteriota bacterium]